MSRSILLVLSNPSPGREDEYNRWYNDVHLDEVLATPGFVAASRFKLTERQADGYPSTGHSYAAIYEIEGDPDTALARLETAMSDGTIMIAEALDVATVTPACFEFITERRLSEGVEA